MKSANCLDNAWLHAHTLPKEVEAPHDGWERLPEKVLQFGTGVLLRGLPDYFIDKANKAGIFNGRIVVVKSTGGATGEFKEQDNVYTLCIRGIEDGKRIDRLMVNTSISRVLSAHDEWNTILALAKDPVLDIVLSNTTEVGIVSDARDYAVNEVPYSFPGRLLAFLHARYTHFSGDADRGMVIVPTELISDNGDQLKVILLQLIDHQGLGDDFRQWLLAANDFCNSLVDRIVPGKLPRQEQQELEVYLGYEDRLMIMAEPFRLWAIASDKPRVRERLGFHHADAGMVITDDISKFKELKLRLLNATHSLSCGISACCGFDTVREAMQDGPMRSFVEHLMLDEIGPAISGDMIGEEEAALFARQVIDRFSNPYLEHKWHQIAFNYSSKMLARVFPLVSVYASKFGRPPLHIALGIAAYLRYMQCTEDGEGKYVARYGKDVYAIQDEYAGTFCRHWQRSPNEEALVGKVFGDLSIWKQEIGFPGPFLEVITGYLREINKGNIRDLLSAIGKESKYEHEATRVENQ